MYKYMKVVTIHLVQYILIYDCDIDKYVKLMTCLKKEPSKQDTIKTTHVSIKNLDSTLRKWGNINWILCKFHYVRSNSLYLHFDMLLLTNYVTFTTIIGLIFDLPLTMCKFPLENNTNCVYDMTLLERDHLFTWSRMGKASHTIVISTLQLLWPWMVASSLQCFKMLIRSFHFVS